MDSIVQSIIHLADRWLGSAISQVVLLFLGLLIGLLVVAGLWERRLKSLGAVLGISVSLVLAAIALEESIGRYVGAMNTLLRLRILAALFGIFIVALTSLARWRSGLGTRLSLMWGCTGGLLLGSAFFTHSFERFPSLLGMGYGAAVLAVLLLFFVLFAFHVSLLLVQQEHQQKALEERLQSLETTLGVISSQAKVNTVQDVEQTNLVRRLMSCVLHPAPETLSLRRLRGTTVAVPLIIFLTVLSVLTVGLMAPQVMIGDEVTHFYMLETQARNMPVPNFFAEIPVGTDGTEVRRYPHSFLWHYLGAVWYRIFNGSFAAVQMYHALFLCQFLGAAYVFAHGREGVSSRSAMLFLLVMASLPMTLIFSVAFYQDVPMAAQVLTAFCFLQRRRWVWGTFFMAFALWIKVNALLFYPVYCIYLLHKLKNGIGWPRMIIPAIGSVMLLLCSTTLLGWCIERYADAEFYPTTQTRKLLNKVRSSALLTRLTSSAEQIHVTQPAASQSSTVQDDHGRPNEFAKLADSQSIMPDLHVAQPSRADQPAEQQHEIIANHPGDLRLPVNYFVYGGVVLWLVVLGGGFKLYSVATCASIRQLYISKGYCGH